MKNILFLFLLFTSQLYGQSEREIALTKLTPCDTINKKYQSIDSLNNSNYYFLNSYKENEGLYFVKLIQGKWVVYDFELDINIGSNTYISKIVKENEDFIRIQTYRFPSGHCANTYGFLILFNKGSNKWTMFPNYHFQECDNIKGETETRNECRSDIELINGHILIHNNQEFDNVLYCTQSAAYKIDSNKLIQTKYSFANSQALYPVVCFDNICTGMNFMVMKKQNPEAVFVKAPLYKYGYDSDKNGFELTRNEQLSLFIVVSNNIITGLTIVSPNYTHNSIKIGMTISEIFDQYPDSKIHLDLITDWEYIAIKKEQIKLIFKTNNTNRIGVYKNEPDAAASKIKRKSTKIDLIQSM